MSATSITQWPGRFAKAAGGLAFGVGAVVLLGWALDISAIKSVLPGWLVMKANTALAFILAGTALWLVATERTPDRTRGWLANGCAGIVTLIGLLTLSEYLTGWDLGIDQMLFREPPGAPATSNPGRMAPITALDFLLLGGALLLARHRHFPGTFQFLTLLAALLGWLGFAAHLYHAELLSHYTRMAAHTALTFFILSGGVLCVRTDGGLMALLISDSAGGVVARRLLPAALLVPLVFGWLRLEGQRFGWYGTETGALMFMLSNVLVFSVLVWISAGMLRRSDTERHRTEVALRKSEAQLQTIVENLNEGVAVSDFEGQLLHFNRAALDLHGFATLEECRRKLPEFADTFELAAMDGTVWPVEQWPLARILRGENLRNLEVRIRRIKTDWRRIFNYGGTLVHNADGRTQLAVVTISDITERERAAEEIRELNATLERRVAQRTVELEASIKESSDLKAALDEHAIVAITDPQGKISYVNDKFCAISQYSREELIGQDHRLVNSRHHPKEFIRNLWTTITQGRVWHGEIRNRAKDRSFYWVDTTIVPFLNKDGKPRQYVAIRTDITERKRAEEKIRQRTAELEMANKELESFSYSVSHDLRAPLRGIAGFAEALARGYRTKLDAEGGQYLDRVLAATERMGHLIDDLLKLSRVNRADISRQTVDLSAMALSIAADLQQSAPHRQAKFLIADGIKVDGDPRLLLVVLENLLGNAWKFTAKKPSARIEFASTPGPDGRLICYVRDDGAGFDMNYATKLFGPFQRLHSLSDFPGTGIGLATVQRIIQRHGGRVWAVAQIDAGATFSFFL